MRSNRIARLIHDEIRKADLIVTALREKGRIDEDTDETWAANELDFSDAGWFDSSAYADDSQTELDFFGEI